MLGQPIGDDQMSEDRHPEGQQCDCEGDAGIGRPRHRIETERIIIGEGNEHGKRRTELGRQRKQREDRSGLPMTALPPLDLAEVGDDRPGQENTYPYRRTQTDDRGQNDREAAVPMG
jgi:hypothetical protein